MPVAATQRDFGVVIPAKEEHLHWVRGTCASVRHFMGDTPICVILDGESFADEIRSTYDVSILRRSEIEPIELRAVGWGSLRAKNAALWASPYETFLSLDADTVVWGDMRQLADFGRFDFVLDLEGEPSRSVMDVEAVVKLVPEFDAVRHVAEFVNTGAYFARRGALSLGRYLELMRLSQAHPAMFYGSQGIFNLMVFEASDREEVRMQRRELQVLTGRTAREDVVRRFSFVDSRPALVGDPVVLHWVGSPKPRVRQRGRDYFEPMTYFRRMFRRAGRGHSAHALDDTRLRLEDMLCTDWRGTNIRGRVARLRRRTRQRYARYRVAIRRRTPDRIVAGLRRRSLTEDHQG